MKIFESKYNISDELNKLLWEVQFILGDESLKITEQCYFFEKRRGLSFNALKNKLIEKGIKFSDSDLNLVLQLLLTNYKMIIRNESWHKQPVYEYLDHNLWDSKYQEAYYSFSDEMSSLKTYLLISDTHIGNDKLFNSKLLHNIYDYAIKHGAKKCFHLGDLFEGSKELQSDPYLLSEKQITDFEEEFCRQLNLFINEYPKTNPDEFMTYSLIGNHDESMNRFLKFKSWFSSCDLRKISMYNPDFYMFPRSNWTTNLNGINIHFNHRLYMSGFIYDLKINKLSDIEIKKEQVGSLLLEPHYDLLISGHLHKGIIYTESNYYNEKNNLYLGVPSTSNFNIGGTVGYLIYMYPESNHMEVAILRCDNNLNIQEIDKVNWEFGTKNKVYKRTL